ncbi:MAG: hypothetical protein ACM4AI_14150 [Acidobacteriota bacterium]
MRVLNFSIALMLSILAGSRTVSPEVVADDQDPASADRVAVWQATIGDVVGRGGSSATYTVLINRTAVSCLPTQRRYCIPDKLEARPYDELSSELRERLAAVLASYSMDVPDVGDPPARLAAPAEIDAIFDETDRLIAALRGTQALVSPDAFWNVFQSRFPRSWGYLVMTAPAFDANRREAVVLTDHMYGSLGGKGLANLLVRDNLGRWTVKVRLPRWVS